MTISDGWLLSQLSMGDPHLVVRRTGSTVRCVGAMYPGSYTREQVLEFLVRIEGK